MTPSIAPALEIANLTSGYGEAMVLRNVSLSLPRGEVLAVLGKNGMGKSTLLKTVMGFLPARGGGVRVAGTLTTGLAPHRMAALGVAYSPQDQAIFHDLSVEENLRLGVRRDRGFEERLAHVATFFPFLAQRRRQTAGTLSGGEQKMLIMARGLMARPRLMLVDEITEGLQPSVIHRLTEVLRSELAAFDLTILLIEQNVQFALSLATRYAVLARGEITEAGRTDEAGTQARIHAQLAV
ncbi:MAG: ABC transporter ATP-binding protein [Janthinobacterium lividum]